MDVKVMIRKAERQDVPLLLEFIRDIARFGRMEDEVIASTGTRLPMTSIANSVPFRLTTVRCIGWTLRRWNDYQQYK